MADQIQKTKSKTQVLQFKLPRLCLKTFMIGLCVLVTSICSVLTATCPFSVPSSAATTTEQCSFTGFTSIYTLGHTIGPVSNSIYSLILLSSPIKATIRKEDASGTLTWQASFAFTPTIKSLSVDAAEQSVYITSLANPLVVFKLAASNGALVSQHQL